MLVEKKNKKDERKTRLVPNYCFKSTPEDKIYLIAHLKSHLNDALRRRRELEVRQKKITLYPRIKLKD